MHFPFRSAHAWNGCRAYRECAAPSSGSSRPGKHSPALFFAVDDTAIQASCVRTVLHHMLNHGHMLPVLPKDRTNKCSFHSLRKFYTTGLKHAGVSNEIIQSLLRWSVVESIDGYNMPSTEDHARMVDAAYNCSVQLHHRCSRRCKQLQLTTTTSYNNGALNATWLSRIQIWISNKAKTPTSAKTFYTQWGLAILYTEGSA